MQGASSVREGRREFLIHFIIMQVSPPTSYVRHIKPEYCQHLFSNALLVFPSRRRSHVLGPYKAAGKIVLLYFNRALPR